MDGKVSFNLNLVEGRTGEVSGTVHGPKKVTNHVYQTLFQFSCGANCVHRRFLITQFLAMMVWVRIPLQVGDRQPVGTLPLFVRQLSTLC